MKHQVCIAQIGFEEDIKKHIRKIKDIISDNRRADLIVFPELILHGHPSLEIPEGLLYRRIKHFYRLIADDSDDLYRFVKSVGARIIIGELKGGPGRFYNVATYIDENTTDSYAKTHVHWTENFLPGKELKIFSSSLGKLGIMICFDGAFSEVWRILSLKGAQIIINISATPKSFSLDYIWRRLQGAALGNQVFIIYVNRPDKIFSGHSAIISPRGETILDVGEGENVVTHEIDLDEVRKWREEEQIFLNRKPLLYRDIWKRTLSPW